MFDPQSVVPLTTYTLVSDDLEGRIAAALDAMRAGVPVILLDDFDRENEADLIVAAETVSYTHLTLPTKA